MSPKSQIFGRFPYRAKTDEKVVALTFDDGPNEPFTSQILEYLDSKDIKATFFQVGTCVQKYPDITRKIFMSGHTIGIHSMSHKFSKYFTQPGFVGEITSSRSIIGGVINKKPLLFRPPWLFRQPILLANLKKLGLQPVSGVFGSPVEVFQPSASKMAKRTLAKVRPGLILIFHDGYDAKGGDRSQTVEATKLVVDGLLAKGYKFVTVDDLLNIPPYK